LNQQIKRLSGRPAKKSKSTLKESFSINCASLLSNICYTPNNILRVSQILLYLPITSVYSIIPSMIIISQLSISIIATILLNMPITATASIIAKINIPLDILFLDNTNRYIILNSIKSDIISAMPNHKAAVILSNSNIPKYQIDLILSHMSTEKSSLILSKMSS
jgi:hypothetical protein